MEALRQEAKADVARVEERIARIEAGMEALRQETKADIARVEERIAKVAASVETVKVDLLKWMFGALIAQGGLIVALVKFL